MPKRWAWWQVALAWVLCWGCARRADFPPVATWAPSDNEVAYPRFDSEPLADVAPSQGEVITREYLERVPVGRSYQSAVSLVAGTTRGSSDGGGRGERRAAEPPPPPPPAPPVVSATPTLAPAPSSGRMVFYQGFARLQDGRPAELRARLEALALDAGGLVELSAADRVLLRVPVDRFEEVYAAVLELAPVLARSVQAQDVTEAFQDAELRLELARSTLTRLQQLLAQATQEEEKLALLREIQRVTEQLDAAARDRQVLARMADLSRIVVQIVGGGQARYTPAEPWGVGWIRLIDPFVDQALMLGRPLRLDPPPGFVVLQPRGPWVAESAEGAVLRSGRLHNAPVGDTAWWAQLVVDRLGPAHEGVEERAHGDWRLVRLVQPGEGSWRWWVAVRATGEHLDVFSATFLSEAMEARYGPDIASVLEADRSR